MEGVPFPEPLRPMEPVPWPAAFDDPAWLWQVKWDGVRCLAVHAGAGQVRLWSRRGLPATGIWPEVAAALPDAVGRRPAVLDGEVVAFGPDGRPSFHLTLRRALRHAAPREVCARLPVAYAVFDLLAWEGRDLRGEPAEARTALLEAALEARGPLYRVATRRGAGTALAAAVAAAGLEGVVGKWAASPYTPGRSPWWRKVKPARRLTLLVAGYRLGPDGTLRALALAGRAAGELVFVGDAGSGLSGSLARELLPLLRRLPDAPPPPGAPSGARAADRRWVRPQVAVGVRCAEFTPTGRLRGAVVLGLAAGAGPEAAELP